MRRSLTVSNETHFDTRAIRALVAAVHRWAAKDEHRAPLRRLHVNVKYARTWGQARGCVGSGHMWLFIRKHDSVPMACLADTIRHELMHNFGYQHSQFYERAVPLSAYAAVESIYGHLLPVRITGEKLHNRPQERAERAQLALAYWQRRLKLATTKVKLYRRRVRYYTNRTADSMGKPNALAKQLTH